MDDKQFHAFEAIKAALQSKNKAQIDKAVYALEPLFLNEELILILNELLIHPNHHSHQRVTRLLQKAKSTTTVPYIRKVLETNFDYLEYTYSESGVIAKWFSWALSEIGTKEAIDLIKEYTTSPDEVVSNEMRYRLNKIFK